MDYNIMTNEDLGGSFEAGDIATAHALLTVGQFLKKIALDDSSSIRVSDVQIDRMTTIDEHPEDTKSNLELELHIVSQVREIGKAILAAADIREASNQRIIAALDELINRK